jgi:hypothetical protein
MSYIIKKTNVPIAFGLVMVASCVCMLSPLNPLSKGISGTDSSVFLTIAKGMIAGKQPYIDFFDHKGPLIYFIDALGLYIAGFMGVWLLELLSMCVSVFFAYKTARFFGNKLAAFAGTAFAFVVLTDFFEGGNLTEEYVLPFIFISLYLFTRYYFTMADPGIISIIVSGACFGFSLLLRPNMFAVWVSFCIVISIQKILQRDFGGVLRDILFFISGLVIVLLPVFLYLKYTRSFDEFIKQCLLFNAVYSSSDATIFALVKSFIKAVNRALLPVMIAFIWILKRPRIIRHYGFCIAYALSLFLSFLLIALPRRYPEHYYIVLVPLFVPPLVFCFTWLIKLFSSIKSAFIRYGAAILMFCIFFNGQIFSIRNQYKSNILTDDKSYFRQLGYIINANVADKEKISVLGNQCAVYLFTDANSVSKYIYQFPPAIIMPEILNEYLSDMNYKKPFLIIIPLDSGYAFAGEFSPVFSIIDDEYYECFRSDRHIIFKRKQGSS